MNKQKFPLLGILGGTFDPPHQGHLAFAHTLLSELAFEQLCVIPCYQPPHRAAPTASPLHRLAMVRCAFAQADQVYVDAREVERGDISYTVPTLQSLQSDYPNHALAWIMGIDAFLGLTSWYRWQDLLTLAHIIVVQRPGFTLPKEGALADVLKQHRVNVAEALHEQKAGHIWLSSIQGPDISASKIRGLLMEGNSKEAQLLLPEVVWRYIMQHKIYT